MNRTIVKIGIWFLALIGVWGATTFVSLRETDVDPDLGIAPSSLSFLDAAMWSLPLSIIVWLACSSLFYLVAQFVRRNSSRQA